MNAKPGKILVIDDDKDILLTTRVVLKKQFGVIKTEADPEMITQQLENEFFDIILLDMNFSAGATSGKEGMKWLREIRKKDESAHVIMMTAYGDIDLAVKAMKEGASDFIVKPWDNQKLMATVINAYRLSQSKREIIELRRKQELLHQDIDLEFSEIIGSSDRMKDVFMTISKVAQTDANVLILGENGTGKELIARALHRESERAKEIFVSVDLGAIPETLFESELFGHVKGAFTDAKDDRSGRFEVASGGTLFLDEIGNLSLPLQSKLLSVVQNRVINRVGSSKETPINIRLICATNMPLYRMVQEKTFREDLISLQQDVYQKLDTYSWPGNIRELQHVIERAIILNDKDTLKPADFLIMHENSRSTDLIGHRMEDVEKQSIQ
jgi:DNA-binding NtrC family response regulator